MKPRERQWTIELPPFHLAFSGHSLAFLIEWSGTNPRLTPRVFAGGVMQQFADIGLDNPVANISSQPLPFFVEDQGGA